MVRVSSLNERQRSTLRLIGGGGDLSGDERVGLRITARSLASRGLVKVRRASGKWQAAITDAGRRVLDQDAQPEGASPSPDTGMPPRQQRRSLKEGTISDQVRSDPLEVPAAPAATPRAPAS
jgi:hypothetical protein